MSALTGDGTGAVPKGPATVPERIAPRVAELHAAGHGRNEVARKLGVSERSVSRAAELAGVTFDGSVTEDATRARVRNIAERQAAAVEALAAVSEAAARRLLVEVRAELLDSQAVRALAIAAGVGYDKVAAFLTTAPDESMADAVDQIAALSDSILTAADAYIGAPELTAGLPGSGGVVVE